MGWIALIIGACFGVYVLAFLVRGVVNFTVSLLGRSVSKRRATYLAVAIASLIAFGISGFGFADGGPPDYSQSWIYLLAGAIVFLFERWRLSKREEETTGVEEAHR